MTGGVIRVGISGWTHAPWRGVFYPRDLKRGYELAYASNQFRAIEINSTFYALQRPDTFAFWAGQAPAHTVFSVKAPRLITHLRRLQNVEVPVANFIASGLLRLGIHLGPILWQLPPNFRFYQSRLEAFLRLLPRDTRSAARLGQRHDSTLRADAWLESDTNRPLRHAMEVRNETFRDRAFLRVLREHNVALVCSDSTTWPTFKDVTSDFVYCRLIGSKDLYAAGYDGKALDIWAEQIKSWASGDDSPEEERIGSRSRQRKRDVFVIFDNDLKVAAPANAMELVRRLRR